MVKSYLGRQQGTPKKKAQRRIQMEKMKQTKPACVGFFFWEGERGGHPSPSASVYFFLSVSCVLPPNFCHLKETAFL